MMAIFFAGVVIHFLIPLETILIVNTKIEEAYNSKKIQVEQSTVRALGKFNSKVVANRFQVYQDLQTSISQLFKRFDPYSRNQFENIHFNSAYQVANMN